MGVAKARIEQFSTPSARAIRNRPRVPSSCSNCILRDSSVPQVTLTLYDDRFYPVPSEAVSVNPRLTHNPGY